MIAININKGLTLTSTRHLKIATGWILH